MISFDADSRRFNLRAAAIVLNGSQVPCTGWKVTPSGPSPAGASRGGELGSSAVVREIAEEFAEPVECGQLLWMVENFFTYRGVSHHELGLYFLVTLHSGSRLLNAPGPYVGVEAGARLTFAWFERSELGGVDVRPSFVLTALAEPELIFRHIVHRDENAA